MSDTTTTLYTPPSTPSQRVAAAAHRARLANIASRARSDSAAVCTTAPVRSAQVAPPYYPQQPPLTITVTISHISHGLVARDRKLSIDVIQGQVAGYFRIGLGEINAMRRTLEAVHARQVAMYLIWKLLPRYSLKSIGQKFGGRDHTTVLHAVRKIEANIKTDSILADDIEALTVDLASFAGSAGESGT